MKTKSLLTLIAFASAWLVSAHAHNHGGAQTFDFKDPKGVNAIQFHLDSLLEPIAGTANGITGEVSFDPANPAATRGTLVVAANSLVVTNQTMTEHLHSAGWLDVANHPEITFKIEQLTDTAEEGAHINAIAHGDFTLRGITHPISVPVRLTHLKGVYGQRLNKPELGGDLLVVRGEFTLLRSDYNIRSGQNEDKVSPEVRLNIAIVGGAPQS
jgi:polyisoprenoid-binding protein YceI